MTQHQEDAYWAHREQGSSSSNFSSSNFSSSIEGKPSMDSVLRPKDQQNQQGRVLGCTTSVSLLIAVLFFCQEQDARVPRKFDRVFCWQP